MNRLLTWLACLGSLVFATTVLADARPNILVCIADDVSYPHMSAYGCSWVKTPAFDRVARDGLLFTRAYPYAHAAIRGFYERFRRGENVKAGWITPSDIEKEPLD